MTHSRLLIAGAVVIGLAAGGAALAQGRPGGPAGRGGPGPMGRMGGAALPLGALNLSDAQRQQIREIGERRRDESRAAAARLREAITAQRAAVQSVPVDEGLIRSTTQTWSDAQVEVALQQAHLHSEIWGVLTPAQQERAKMLRSERASRMQQRRERMRERRPGPA